MLISPTYSAVPPNQSGRALEVRISGPRYINFLLVRVVKQTLLKTVAKLPPHMQTQYIKTNKWSALTKVNILAILHYFTRRDSSARDLEYAYNASDNARERHSHVAENGVLKIRQTLNYLSLICLAPVKLTLFF